MKLLSKVRTRAGVAVIGAALLAVGGTATAAVVTSSPETEEVSDQSVFTTEPAATTTAPAPTSAPAPAPVVSESSEAPGLSPEADTVEPVTEPEAPAPQQPADNDGIGTTGPDGYYTPAPVAPLPNGAGANVGGRIIDIVPPLPGEPGYVEPTPAETAAGETPAG